jgi:predicted nucleotidyltransferase
MNPRPLGYEPRRHRSTQPGPARHRANSSVSRLRWRSALDHVDHPRASRARLAAVCDKYGIAELKVFGSRACGQAAPGGAIDILLLTEMVDAVELAQRLVDDITLFELGQRERVVIRVSR